MSRATVRASSTSSSTSTSTAVSRRRLETIGKNHRRARGRVVPRARKGDDDGAFDAMRGREMLERALRRAMGTGGERRGEDGTRRFEANALSLIHI